MRGILRTNGPRRASAFLSLILAAVGAYANNCVDGRDFFQYLPTEIGREDQSGRFRFAFKCDTVFVRRGVTAVVHPGTMLYFERPSLNSVIKVEGTLKLVGSKNSFVVLGGSLDSLKRSDEPGDKPWGGIEVAEGGRLEMDYAGIYRAPTPITAFSKKVRITNSFFKGSSGIILPDGNLLETSAKFEAVNELDLEKDSRKSVAMSRGKSSDTLNRVEKDELLKNTGSSFWTWKKASGGVALLAAAVGAAYVMAAGGGESGDTDRPVTPTKKNTLESLPPLPAD